MGLALQIYMSHEYLSMHNNSGHGIPAGFACSSRGWDIDHLDAFTPVGVIQQY